MAYNPKPTGKYEVSDDGGSSWHRIFNITNFSISGGDREEETTDTLDEGSTVSVGPARQKDVSMACNATPGSAGYKIITKAYRDSKTVTFRITTDSEKILDNSDTSDKVAIATTGIVTGTSLDFSDEKWKVGRGIKVGTTVYVIESITDDTHLVVSPKPTTAVAATSDFELIEYGLRWQFEANVLSAGNVDASPGSPMTDTFTIKQTGLPADPTLQAPA